MSKLPKILVGCPQSDKKAYCFDDWLANIKKLTYPNHFLHLSDNSNTKDFSTKIMDMGVSCNYVKPRGKSEISRIADGHNDIRTFAISYGFDYLMHIESDVFPPANIIEHLLAARKSVIGAMYHIGFGYDSRLMVQTVDENTDDGFRVTRGLRKDVLEILNGSIHKAYHVGLGCILIHRTVLERIQFRYVPGKNFHPDSFFAVDCYNANPRIEIFADTSVICEHRNIAHELSK